MNTLLITLLYNGRTIHSLVAISHVLFAFTFGVITNRICRIVLNYFQLKYTVHLASISTKYNKVELFWLAGTVLWFLLSMEYQVCAVFKVWARSFAALPCRVFCST
jgi:hypothetical protein